MSNIPIFMQGDAVYYTGEKFKSELTKDGKPMRGWIHAPVDGEPGVFVVEFPEAKDGDYIIPSRLLSRARPPKGEKHEGPEIRPRRQKKEAETE